MIFVDEVAFLTAYQADRKFRDRTLAAIATLTTQGRAVGYCVVAALQDPRKDVLTIRNLFPDRIAMRLDEAEQVDMVLGDGSRDRGATADLISSDPATGRRHRLRPARNRPRPRPRRLGHRRRHHRHVPPLRIASPGRRTRRCRTGSSRVTGQTTWRTDDPCPVCGTGLLVTDDTDGAQVAHDCRLCGWSATWQAALDMTTEA